MRGLHVSLLLSGILLLASACTASDGTAEATVTAQAERIAQLEAAMPSPTATRAPADEATRAVSTAIAHAVSATVAARASEAAQASATAAAAALITRPTQAPTMAPTLTAAQLVQSVASSVVRIVTNSGQSTGFVAFEAGQVVTALHGIDDYGAILTVVASDGTLFRAMMQGADEKRDLALLAVPAFVAPPLAFGTEPAVGDPVFTMGFAAALEGAPSITQGIVSARRVVSQTGIVYLQTDAPINPGCSGGPLLNKWGEVAGVNVLRLGGTDAPLESMGFAIAVGELILASKGLQAGLMTLVPTPTLTPAPIREWCAFRAKAQACLTAIDAWARKYAAYVNRMPHFEGDSAAFSAAFDPWLHDGIRLIDEYSGLRDMACSLPRSPWEARSIADTLCISAEAEFGSLQRGDDSLRVLANLRLREANDMLSDVDRQFGNPSCK